MDPRVRIHTKMLWIRNTAYLWLEDPDPDPGGQKTYGSDGSGSATLVWRLALNQISLIDGYMIRNKILTLFYYYVAQTGTLRLIECCFQNRISNDFLMWKFWPKVFLGFLASGCILVFLNSLLVRSVLLSFLHGILGSMLLIFFLTESLIYRPFGLVF